MCELSVSESLGTLVGCWPNWLSWGLLSLSNPHEVQLKQVQLPMIQHLWPISTGYVSAAFRLIGFTLVYVLISTRFGVLRICMSQLRQSEALQSRYTRPLFLADAGARRSNSAEFSTEQIGSQAWKQQYNIQLFFKIKHSMLTPAHKSQKRDKHNFFCLSLSREHFVLLFL